MTKEEFAQQFEEQRRHVLSAPADCACELCEHKRTAARLIATHRARLHRQQHPVVTPHPRKRDRKGK